MSKILELKNVSKIYSEKVKIEDINFDIFQQECVSLIGESGCGKSTIAKMIVGLVEKSAGEILYKDKNIADFDKNFLASKIQMIFQSPYSSLNPKYRVKDLILEGVKYHKKLHNKYVMIKYAISLLKEVGLDESFIDKFPHELSGGQRQRINIARAIAMQPELIIADESLSALDMITQYQILDLFEKLKKTRHLSVLFISHDISVVKKISDRILVMHEGKIVEANKKKEIFSKPQHFFTQELLKISSTKNF